MDPGLDSYPSTPSLLSCYLPWDPYHLGSGSSVESTEEHEDSVTNKDTAGHHAKHMSPFDYAFDAKNRSLEKLRDVLVSSSHVHTNYWSRGKEVWWDHSAS